MKRVVVFDDSRTVRMFVQMALSERGYEVETFAEPYEYTPSEAEPPDLVLLDVNMDEFFGTDLVGHMRQNWPGEPLIYLYSDLPEGELAQKAKSCGADGYISKSWGFDGLLAAVHKLRKRSA